MRTVAAAAMNRSRLLAAFGATFVPRAAFAQVPPPLIRLAAPTVDSAVSAIYGIRSRLFQRAGLDVQFVVVANGGATAAAVVGGAAEIAYQNVLSAANAYLHGVPFQIVSAGQVFTSKSPDPVLLVLKDSPIRSARDLDGKTIATSELHDLGSTGLAAWLDQNGGDSSSVKLIEIPYSAMAAALEGGRVQAATVLAPASTRALDSGNFRIVAAFFTAIAPTFMTTAWCATADWIASHQDAALRFSRAMRAAAIYANAHRDETAPMLAAMADIDVATIEHGVRAMLAERLDLTQLQRVIDLLVRYKALDRDFDVRNMVSPSVAAIWR